jgi:hypothetical protein
VTGIQVTPRVTAVFEHRKASSGCCGSLLAPAAAPGAFTCRGCGQPCDRVLSEPTEVTVHG